jgi:hypothetical protein
MCRITLTALSACLCASLLAGSTAAWASGGPPKRMTQGQAIASSPSSLSAACASTNTVRITPAENLQLLDDFRARLSAGDRRHLDRAIPRGADGGIASCDTGEGSRASCEAAAYMPALRSTGLMPRFLATICPTKTPILPGGRDNHIVPPR